MSNVKYSRLVLLEIQINTESLFGSNEPLLLFGQVVFLYISRLEIVYLNKSRKSKW